MSTVPCLHPDAHHVATHRLGSQAARDCQSGNVVTGPVSRGGGMPRYISPAARARSGEHDGYATPDPADEAPDHDGTTATHVSAHDLGIALGEPEPGSDRDLALGVLDEFSLGRRIDVREGEFWTHSDQGPHYADDIAKRLTASDDPEVFAVGRKVTELAGARRTSPAGGISDLAVPQSASELRAARARLHDEHGAFLGDTAV